MNVIIGCEESQAVCIEFRKLGINAFSCDLQECSGGRPEWHFNKSIFDVVNGGKLITQSGDEVYIDKWDLGIFHPPCTFMSNAGARWMYPKAGQLSIERYKKALDAKDFFTKLLNLNIDKIAVENPTPLKIVKLPKETQSIQPFEYGHNYSKKTLLWLKNLPKLKPTNIVRDYKPYLPSNTGGKKRGQSYSFGVSKNAKESSKTFTGIAKAMAEQWSDLNNFPIQQTLELY